MKIKEVIQAWRAAKRLAKRRRKASNGSSQTTNLPTVVFSKLLKEKGFRYLDCGAFKTTYHKDEVDFVVKIYDSDEYVDDAGFVRFKFRDYYLAPFYQDYGIVIQPKADTSDRYSAIDSLVEIFGRKYLNYFDIHEFNVGHRNGKPVIFDFEHTGRYAS